MAIDSALLDSLTRYLADATDARPVYRKLADALNEAMRSDQGGVASHLPSERSLAEALGISRVTVRNALDRLAADGLVSRRQGARTKVATRFEKSLAALTGFSDELRARGFVPGEHWISKKIVAPTAVEAMALDLAGNDRILRLERVRLADGKPLAIERAAVPAAILDSADLVAGSLYAALAKVGAAPVRGAQRLRAGVMGRTEALLLKASLGAPILIVERRCFLADGRPVEFTETRYNGESYEFLTELRA